MDPITGVVVKAGATWLGSKFKSFVIDRWARRRAEAFFETFVAELAANDETGQPLSNMEPLLSQILDDEVKAEVLFDAYRRVSLSASPSIGPRVVAVLTARLVAYNRTAEASEERLLLTAEALSDYDFRALCTFLSEHPPDKNDEVKLFDDTDDSNAFNREMRIGPVNLGEQVGNWSLKLQSTGLLAQDVVTKVEYYSRDPERHIDEDGTITTYTWMLRFQPEALELKRIVEGLRSLAE